VNRNALAFVTAFVLACDGGGGGGTSADVLSDGVQADYPAVGAGITLTGTLGVGQISGVLHASVKSALQDGDPLVGYRLYCVTFTDPPAAGGGEADASGAFSLDFQGGGVPFGCFVRDASDGGAATVFFGTPSASSETVVVPGTVDLGEVVVDLDKGVALAPLPAGASLVTTTPSAAECPAGTWTGDVTTKCGTTVVSLWIAKDPSGTLLVASTSSNTPIGDPATGPCGTFSLPQFPGVAWMESTRAFSMVLTADNGFTYGYDGTADAGCTVLDGTAWYQQQGGPKTSEPMQYTRR
jgi:hypothetical protein